MKMLKRVVLFLLSGYLLVVISLYTFQESLIFIPESLEQNYKYSFSSPVKEFNIENNGTSLNALHFKADSSKGVILYFHGNAGNLSRWGTIIQPLLKYDYDLIVMDYRGYGKSQGEFSEELMYGDARVFYDYAKTQYPENQIIVYGRSLGTAFATHVASNNNPQKLILETPFYSIVSVAKNKFPFLPINWLLNYRFESNKMADFVSCPTLVLLSGKDEVVSYESGLKLSQEFNQVKMINLEQAGHNNQAQFEQYWSALEDFLKH